MLGALGDAEIEELLRSQAVGRIGLHALGRTYVVPVTYALEGGAVIGHTTPGLKLDLARVNPQVCFEVDEVKDLASWRSVICQGRFVELEGAEAAATLKRFVQLLLPRMTGPSALPSHGLSGHPAAAGHPHGGGGRQGVVWRIELTERSGRFERP